MQTVTLPPMSPPQATPIRQPYGQMATPGYPQPGAYPARPAGAAAYGLPVQAPRPAGGQWAYLPEGAEVKMPSSQPSPTTTMGTGQAASGGQTPGSRTANGLANPSGTSAKPDEEAIVEVFRELIQNNPQWRRYVQPETLERLRDANGNPEEILSSVGVDVFSRTPMGQAVQQRLQKRGVRSRMMERVLLKFVPPEHQTTARQFLSNLKQADPTASSAASSSPSASPGQDTRETQETEKTPRRSLFRRRSKDSSPSESPMSDSLGSLEDLLGSPSSRLSAAEA